jgi:hypothetical protein
VTGDASDLATAVVEQVQPIGVWEANQHLTARAVLSAARGELDEAADLYREAAEAWASFGNVVERARCLVGQVRLLAEQGRAVEAGDLLAQAREIFVRLGAQVFIDETDELSARAVRGSPA